jgi:hypothetical protein
MTSSLAPVLATLVTLMVHCPETADSQVLSLHLTDGLPAYPGVHTAVHVSPLSVPLQFGHLLFAGAGGKMPVQAVTRHTQNLRKPH